MSSKGFAAPLRLEFQASRQCLFLVTVITGLALLALILLDLSWWIQLMLAVLVLIWFARLLGRMGWRKFPAAIHRVEWQDAQWRVSVGDKMELAELLGYRLIGQGMIILSFAVMDTQGRARTQHVFSCRDGLQADAFRHLRVFLRHAPVSKEDEVVQ